MGYNHVTPEDIFRNEEVRCYIQRGNDCLGAIGYTEHGFAHAKKAATPPGKSWRLWAIPSGIASWPPLPGICTTLATPSTGWTTPTAAR